MPKQYKIETIQDMMEIPLEKFNSFLIELCQALLVARAAYACHSEDAIDRGLGASRSRNGGSAARRGTDAEGSGRVPPAVIPRPREGFVVAGGGLGAARNRYPGPRRRRD